MITEHCILIGAVATLYCENGTGGPIVFLHGAAFGLIRQLDLKQNPTQTSTRPRIRPKNGRLQIGMLAGMKSE
ncbi:hypothetical protein EN958_00005 [Mesorhizobium sp. M7A.F.Ca.CA.002.15.1.1]|nr:hypothetical protein EOD00_00580 [Mesorhizobium sp. M7A.T.Ca.TU.009.01.3.1]RUZ16142.1 hypothetical protein EN958_00005 [Mesorhizobium sp. M7A.F.Ca.CA.002.15.1.1]